MIIAGSTQDIEWEKDEEMDLIGIYCLAGLMEEANAQPLVAVFLFRGLLFASDWIFPLPPRHESCLHDGQAAVKGVWRRGATLLSPDAMLSVTQHYAARIYAGAMFMPSSW